jgi:hypothetical protein
MDCSTSSESIRLLRCDSGGCSNEEQNSKEEVSTSLIHDASSRLGCKIMILQRFLLKICGANNREMIDTIDSRCLVSLSLLFQVGIDRFPRMYVKVSNIETQCGVFYDDRR